jgi:AraC family transcriptional regulator, positive regulator of tynA and feaB
MASWPSAQRHFVESAKALGCKSRLLLEERGVPTTTHWSTDSVRPDKRVAFWREAVCAAVLNVIPERAQDGFHAAIAGRSFGPLRFASFSSTGHDIVREARHVDRGDEDQYLISLQKSGRCSMAQGDCELWLDPGEIAIIDGGRPFRVRFPKPVSRFLAVVPRSTLDMRAPWIRGSGICKIAASSPFSDLARRHIRQLANDEALDVRQAQTLTENLCNLLALSTTADAAVETVHAEAQIQAIQAYCRARLSDPDLSPSRVAAHFRISVRTLHLRFEASEQSFGKWLLNCRLDQCHHALLDKAQDARSVSEIAYRFGFGDLSHFTKSFKSRFGNTPRGIRKSR